MRSVKARLGDLAGAGSYLDTSSAGFGQKRQVTGVETWTYDLSSYVANPGQSKHPAIPVAASGTALSRHS